MIVDLIIKINMHTHVHIHIQIHVQIQVHIHINVTIHYDTYVRVRGTKRNAHPLLLLSFP